MKTVTEVEARGVRLEFGTFAELSEINRKNRDSWRPLLSTFQPRLGGVTEDNGFVILGRDANGDVVATQALRVFDWQTTTLKAEAESLRLFYANPKRDQRPNEVCSISAPLASEITGRVAWSGGVWNRPDYRGRQLGDLIPRMSRCYGLAKYDIASSAAFMSTDNVAKKLHVRAGFSDLQESVLLKHSQSYPEGKLVMFLARQTSSDIIDDAFRFLVDWRAKEDARIVA
ncbi:MAG: hypothetical protein JXQ99_08390 [Hyphomicrobiaceae bacterium]